MPLRRHEIVLLRDGGAVLVLAGQQSRGAFDDNPAQSDPLRFGCARVWFVPRAYRERALLLEVQERKREAVARITVLKRDLAKARKHISGLEQSLERARCITDQSSPAPYRRVGLAENVPLHVLVAAQKSYRRRLHPDGHPAHRKAEATRRFQECEAIFDEVFRLRGF
jgi:hypothetical protein